MAESGAPFDVHGEPLAPVIAWHDRRGEEIAERLDDRFGVDLSGRIGQRIRYIATTAKLGWLVDDGLHGVTTWLGVPELVLHALTGAEATEHSLAARTACLDVTTAEWLPDVADGGGLRRRRLPRDPPGGCGHGSRDNDRSGLVGPPGNHSRHPCRARPPGRLRR